MIRFESVSKRFPDGTLAVDELSIEAPSGKITVLVGPSGCGKTTSLRMINRMIDPTSGRIMLDDKDTAKIDPAQLRRGIGYVIQHAGLFPHRTVVDNVATVPLLLGVDRRTARKQALELLERVGLPANFAKRYPAQLSGGQQQRVGVARALAADPPVMLMDEPFSAVDPVVREQLQNEFLRLQQDLGKTIAFVTHDIDEAIKLGDKVAVMRVGGTLAQFAEPAELLSHPADAFVAGFVGRDRGYRALGFADAGDLATADEDVVRLNETLRSARDRAQDGWALVVDDDKHPQGWIAVGGLADSAVVGTVTPELLNLGGTLAKQSGTLREALDAALSSPSGRGVVVDDEGHLVGTINAAEVLERIESRAASIRQDSVKRGRTQRGAVVMIAVWDYFTAHRSDVMSWLGTTLWLALIPLIAGLIVAMPIGWLASRYRWSYPPITSGAGLLYTIPSLVLFLVLPGLLGTKILDPVNVAVGLTVYTVALLVRIVADGLNSVSDDTLAAAAAMGYTARQRFFAVQFRLRYPSSARDCASRPCRTSAWSRSRRSSASRSSVSCSSTATTCDLVPPTVLGLILFMLLALVFDAVILLVIRVLTPWQRVAAMSAKILADAGLPGLTRVAVWFNDPQNWWGPTGLVVRIREHLIYTGIIVLIAVLIALPLGLIVGHTGRGMFAVVGVANGLRAVPTLGFVILLFLLLSSAITTTFAIPDVVDRGGLANFIAVLIVLVLLALPPILTNTYAGVQNVDPAVRDAARGMGMTGAQIVRKVEFPCALPLIMSGIRSATAAGDRHRHGRRLPAVPRRPRALHQGRRGRPEQPPGRLSRDGRRRHHWSRCSPSSSTRCSTSSSATSCRRACPAAVAKNRPDEPDRTSEARWRRN